MAANTQTTALRYMARKCRWVPGSLLAGTTFEPTLTARLTTESRRDFWEGGADFFHSHSVQTKSRTQLVYRAL